MHTPTTAHNPSASSAPHTRRFVNAGALSVGPITLERALTEASQNVEVSFRAQGRRDHTPIKLCWRYEDQEADRFWMIFGRQIVDLPRYQYKVRVILQGDRVTEDRAWEDEDWRDASGSGPLIVTLPTRETFRPRAFIRQQSPATTLLGVRDQGLEISSFGLSTPHGSSYGFGWALRSPEITSKSDAPVPPSVEAN